MKHVSIIIPRGHFSLVNVEGTRQMFGWVNTYLNEQGKGPLFDLNLVGLDNPTTQTNGLFTVNPQYTLNDVSQTDLIVVPAIHGPLETALKDNQELLPWLETHYRKGSELVTYCIGTFILAETGLLDGNGQRTRHFTRNEGMFLLKGMS